MLSHYAVDIFLLMGAAPLVDVHKQANMVERSELLWTDILDDILD